MDRIYIGVHKTTNPEIFDGYLGCGVYVDQPSTYMYPKTPFLAAVKKYGPDAFVRSTLYIFDSLEEAYKKEADLVDINFIKLSHTYNIAVGGHIAHNYKSLYQFNLNGELVKKWELSLEAYEFYGYSQHKFYFAIHGKYAFLNYYWSFNGTINVNDYTDNKHGSPKYVYLYDINGKFLQEFESYKDCANYVGLKDLTKAINLQQLINNLYYVSEKLVDEFKPKPRLSLMDATFFVYKNNTLLVKCKGKELMPIIDLYSWSSIRDIFRYGLNWYKDFYISLEEVSEVPDKVYKHKILVDVYDKFGNFIETLDSVKLVKLKYNIPSSKIKNIQKGDKYFNDYIFKYHNK